MNSEHIIQVSEATFETEVIHYSAQKPVIVDFWAAWCIPCKVLGPILEKLVNQANGALRLAKIDVDENPRLAQRFNIYSIPAVKAFKEGRIVAEFNGALPEPKILEFIRNLAPSPSDLLLEKGNSLATLNRWKEAESTFAKMLETEHNHPGALLGLAKSQLAQGQAREALFILRSFPPSKEYNSSQMLLPLAQTIIEYIDNQPVAETDLDSAYWNAIRLIIRGNIYASLDGLIDIIRRDKRFKNGKPRLLVLALLEILGENNPETRNYRSELATALY